MSEQREKRRAKASLETARNNPAELYDAQYFGIGYDATGEIPYGRNEHFLKFFGKIACKIERYYSPKTYLDVGCAFGMLVEALVDRGVDARGIDISDYAISQCRIDIADRLSVHHVTEPLPRPPGGGRYDMLSCIEVIEHLPPEQTDKAIDNLCDAADRILFSSSPDDFDEPTHFNVRPTDEWKAMFAKRGFVPSRRSKAPYVAAWAFVVEREELRRGLLYRLFG